MTTTQTNKCTPNTCCVFQCPSCRRLSGSGELRLTIPVSDMIYKLAVYIKALGVELKSSDLVSATNHENKVLSKSLADRSLGKTIKGSFCDICVRIILIVVL